ncbi:hypothetical protein PCL_11352 [Purpureocillium lilacinum]|uniref:Uncharacterized protein n=1 Tax=Purpureocillium lilacinum TaxID=33203 RepID=A0A2U3DPQ0_PURLI|nr:hypothetical protein PCL_11352 [Purpureocillium lilacinum]
MRRNRGNYRGASHRPAAIDLRPGHIPPPSVLGSSQATWLVPAAQPGAGANPHDKPIPLLLSDPTLAPPLALSQFPTVFFSHVTLVTSPRHDSHSAKASPKPTMAPRIAFTRKNKHAAHTHHADIVEKVAQRENDERRVIKPACLNARQRAALREQLRDVRFLKPDCADGTKINIARMLRKWEMHGPPARLE